jgi:hypothetical protein
MMRLFCSLSSKATGEFSNKFKTRLKIMTTKEFLSDPRFSQVLPGSGNTPETMKKELQELMGGLTVTLKSRKATESGKPVINIIQTGQQEIDPPK